MILEGTHGAILRALEWLCVAQLFKGLRQGGGDSGPRWVIDFYFTKKQKDINWPDLVAALPECGMMDETTASLTWRIWRPSRMC